jgi:hypothetical protein
LGRGSTRTTHVELPVRNSAALAGWCRIGTHLIAPWQKMAFQKIAAHIVDGDSLPFPHEH